MMLFQWNQTIALSPSIEEARLLFFVQHVPKLNQLFLLFGQRIKGIVFGIGK